MIVVHPSGMARFVTTCGLESDMSRKLYHNDGPRFQRSRDCTLSGLLSPYHVCQGRRFDAGKGMGRNTSLSGTFLRTRRRSTRNSSPGMNGQSDVDASSSPSSTQESRQRQSNGGPRESQNKGNGRRAFHTFPSIQGRDFQHPLDKQNTNILRSLPGLQFIAKSMIMSAGAEDVLFLENISSSVRVGPSQLPTLYGLLTEACEILGMDQIPDVYVRQNPSPNAYTLALSGRRPFIVLHTSLLDLLDDGELQAVIAHELGHLKCDHAVWLTAANVLALGTVSLLPIFTATVEDQVMRWLRAAELSCDRAALLVSQDPKVVVRSFMKLAGGSSRMSSELNVDAFLEQARSYEQATSSPLGWYLRNAQNRALSHPLPVLRAREIDAWSHSEEYRSLVLLLQKQKSTTTPVS